MTNADFGGWDRITQIRVEVQTSVEEYAGTDADIYFGIEFSNGKSFEHLLHDPSRDDFERGNNDTFCLTVDNPDYLGSKIIKLWIRMGDLRGLFPEWKLDWIKVFINGSELGQFEAKRWFQKKGDRVEWVVNGISLRPNAVPFRLGFAAHQGKLLLFETEYTAEASWLKYRVGTPQNDGSIKYSEEKCLRFNETLGCGEDEKGSVVLPQMVSDGERFIYLIRYGRNSFNQFHLNRLVLTKEDTLQPAFDVRNNGTSEDPKWDFTDQNGDFYYSPTQSMELSDSKGVISCPLDAWSVLLIPSLIPKEKRWTFVAVDMKARDLVVASWRQGEDGLLASESRDIISSFNPDGTPIAVSLPGREMFRIPLSSIGASEVDYISAITYAEKLDGTSTLCLMVSLVKSDGQLAAIRIKVLADGRLSTKPQDRIIWPNGLGSIPSPAKPALLESGDGTVHMYYPTNSRKREARVSIYNTSTQEWTKTDTARIPDYNYDSSAEYVNSGICSFWAPVVWEFGITQGSPEKGDIQGILKRLYIYTDWGPRSLPDATFIKTVGDIVAEYAGRGVINETLLGYIEGAPPVPEANLTSTKNNDASKLSYIIVNGSTRNWSSCEDSGFDILSEGNLGGFAWDISGSNKILKNSSIESSVSLTETLTSNLKTDNDNKVENVGIALIEGLAVDIWQLKLKKNADHIICYSMIPAQSQAKECRIVSFRINDNYIKNGDIKSYVKADLPVIESDILKKKKALEAYYSSYQVSASSKLPDDKRNVLNQNLIADIQWDSYGSRTSFPERAYMTSSSLGGSFEFKTVGGVGVSFEVGFLLSTSQEFKIMLGGHMNSTVTKSASENEAVRLQVDIQYSDFNLDKPGAVDGYSFRTYMLEPDEKHFWTFFNTVVDRGWLAGSSSRDAQLLLTLLGRPNAAWRILYRVYDCHEAVESNNLYKSAANKLRRTAAMPKPLIQNPE